MPNPSLSVVYLDRMDHYLFVFRGIGFLEFRAKLHTSLIELTVQIAYQHIGQSTTHRPECRIGYRSGNSATDNGHDLGNGFPDRLLHYLFADQRADLFDQRVSGRLHKSLLRDLLAHVLADFPGKLSYQHRRT